VTKNNYNLKSFVVYFDNESNTVPLSLLNSWLR